MVILQVAFLFDAPSRTSTVIALFGAVMPMVFGMAYLLLPSYVGRTLSTPWLPGVHFLVTYAGAGLIAGYELFGLENSLLVAGTLLWTAGIVIFVGTLLVTALPAIAATPEILNPFRSRSRRSTRLVTIAIPIAVWYLLLGTVALLSVVPWVPNPLGATFPMIVHLYAVGFVTLLIFALGIRLMTGFFHVTPPKSLSWLVLSCGSVAPGVLSLHFWRPPWFVVGASLESIAMTAYAILVAIVVYRTDSQRIGLYGIGFGAFGGFLGVCVALSIVFGISGANGIDTHILIILDRFLLLTIIGYAYQFFPVTNEQFTGATPLTGLMTIVALGSGTAFHALGEILSASWIHTGGSLLAFVGVSGYSYLLTRRLLS